MRLGAPINCYRRNQPVFQMYFDPPSLSVQIRPASSSTETILPLLSYKSKSHRRPLGPPGEGPLGDRKIISIADGGDRRKP